MHADFDRFEWAEEDIGYELCCRAGSKVDDRFGCVWEELLAVVVLEDFVGSIFTGALERVANKCWGPAEKDAADTLFSSNFAPGLEVGLVDVGIDLTTAFY